MVAHTLGNPFDSGRRHRVLRREHDLWLIEDCCDALGSTYRRPQGRHFGDLATAQLLSGPPHHDGRGRRVLTTRAGCKVLAESFRDWGRDCWCAPGKDNTCGKRFDQQLGDLPRGYDHKYIYSHIGYNLKLTDMQAAVGSGAARQARRLHRGAPTELRPLYVGLARSRGAPDPARGHAEQRSELVRLSARVRPDGPPIARDEMQRFMNAARSPRGCCSGQPPAPARLPALPTAWSATYPGPTSS